MENYRGTHAQINLQAISNNINTLKNRIKEGTKVLLPVKANAYGHGSYEVAAYVENEAIVDMLGVATIEEGLELRQKGINLPILIFGYIMPENDCINAIVQHNITPAIGDLNTAEKINSVAKALGVTHPVHLKVDTGMGRLGCTAKEALPLAQTIGKLDNISIEGVFSHMPVSDVPSHPFNNQQIELFESLHKELRPHVPDDTLFHLANSGAILHYPITTSFNMVRPGILSYGYHPDPNNITLDNITPSMTLMSRILFTKHVKKGTPISYGHTYKLAEDAYVATIACGYGDGYRRSLSNNSWVIINNKEYPVIGRICMDLMMIDCGNDGYNPGTPVTVFSDYRWTAENVAKQAATIPYEITCGISARVPRYYV